ncbi:MAG TPA: hypothetical protein PKC29_04440 [Thermodesulfobacteriota bacterium]|nr:hypothetical protein [Thermodesulfobacteriota bacterium]
MKIESPAGELEVHITGVSVEGESIVLDADLGVWDIRVFVGPRDFRLFFSVLFRRDVILLLLKRIVPFRMRAK